MILVDEAVVRRGLVAKAVLTDEQPKLTRDAIWQAVTESVSTPDIRLNATTTLRGPAVAGSQRCWALQDAIAAVAAPCRGNRSRGHSNPRPPRVPPARRFRMGFSRA
jgi:hypothetical protein